MAWNGVGQYLLNPSFSPEVNGNIIDAVRYNGLTTDVAGGISNAIAKDGQNVPTHNLPMAGYKHTGAGPASASGEYTTWEQVTLLTDLLGLTATTGAGLIGYLYNVGYAPDTTGDALDSLFDAIQDLLGTANQITVTQTSATVITLSFPNAIQFPGTIRSNGYTDGVAVPAGKVSETVGVGGNTSLGSLTSGVTASVQVATLTAGIWMVGGVIRFQMGSAVQYNFAAGGLDSSAGLPSDIYVTSNYGGTTAIGATRAAQNLNLILPTRMINSNAGINVYAGALANFTGGTVTASCAPWAVRIG